MEVEVVWTVSELETDGAERKMDPPSIYSDLESQGKEKN